VTPPPRQPATAKHYWPDTRDTEQELCIAYVPFRKESTELVEDIRPNDGPAWALVQNAVVEEMLSVCFYGR
jgi:hypothetical protein